MNTTAFDYALVFTLKWEGGYSNDRDDPGGETKYGITKATFEHAKRLGIVSKSGVGEITREDAEAIYRALYWEPLKCGELPLWAGVLVFDTAVNQGLYWAVLHLQSALNSLYIHDTRAPRYYLKEDGVLGEKTLSAVRDLRFRAYTEIKQLFIRLYCVNRDIRYTEIILNNPKLKKFLRGWFLRTSDLQDYAKTFLEEV